MVKSKKKTNDSFVRESKVLTDSPNVLFDASEVLTDACSKKPKSLKCKKADTPLSESEKDCIELIKTFFKSGSYAREKFRKVQENIWKHYGIVPGSKRQSQILKTASHKYVESGYESNDDESMVASCLYQEDLFS